MTLVDLSPALRAVRPQRVGVVDSVVGLGLTVAGLDCAVGEIVRVGSDDGTGIGTSPVEPAAGRGAGVEIEAGTTGTAPVMA